MDLSEYEGHEFPVKHKDVGGSCIDYWFDKAEVDFITKDSPLVPEGYTALARDPGDDLILQASDGSMHYCCHENGEIIFLESSLEKFLGTIDVE